jgi:iron complex outermembrane receptor protein
MSEASVSHGTTAAGPVWIRACFLAFLPIASLMLAGRAGAQEPAAKPTELPPVVVQQPHAGGKTAKSASTSSPAAPGPAETTSAEHTSPTALGSYNPALDVSGLTLPPGTTITTAGPVDGYRALTAMSATRTATPVAEIPQSIEVVPRSLIEDQQSVSVSEAARNVSNVQGGNTLAVGNADRAPVKIRGFGAEQWLDGLPVPYNVGNRSALANVERIEVLKGANAILYGGGFGAPVGGAINVVSKLPTNVAGGEVGFTVGSHAYLAPMFDVNQPLSADGSVLFRITGEYTAADSFVDVLDQDRYALNPTLTLTDKTDTTLTIQGRVSHLEQQAYQGLPATGTVAGAFHIDPDLFIGTADIPRSKSEVEGITVTLDHRFSPGVTGSVRARWSEAAFDQNSQPVVGGDQYQAIPRVPPSSWAIANADQFQEQEEFTINPSLQGRFGVGESRNTLLVGADYSRVTDEGHLFAAFLPGLVDLDHPVFPFPYVDPVPGMPGFTPFFDFENVYTTMGLYAQLQSTLWGRVHLLGGLRLADIDIDYFEKALPSPQSFDTEKTKLLPRTGAVVDLTPGLSVYASYGEGMQWGGFARGIVNPKPEESQQREAGFKFNAGGGLTGTIAVFDIDRLNAPAPAGFGVSVLTDQHARGIDADAIWQPDRNWRVLASYGFVDAEFANNTTVAAKGNGLPGVPEHSGRLWVNYTFDPDVLRGWSVGAGIYLASGAFVESGNLFKTDGYLTIDTSLAYETDRYKTAFNVKNVTDEHYFVQYTWLGGQVAPGEDRTFYGTFAIKY